MNLKVKAKKNLNKMCEKDQNKTSSNLSPATNYAGLYLRKLLTTQKKRKQRKMKTTQFGSSKNKSIILRCKQTEKPHAFSRNTRIIESASVEMHFTIEKAFIIVVWSLAD